MSWYLRGGLLSLSLLAVAGCGDSADSLLRTSINQKSEVTDRLMKVTDEKSAKRLMDSMKEIGERSKALNDKWLAWVKDTDDEASGKARVVNFKSNGQPGDARWEEDALAIPGNQPERFVNTRKAFVNYMHKVNADKARFEREKARIAELIKQLEEEAQAKGDRPNPKELWPNLVKINDPILFNDLLVAGADKR